MVAVLKALDTKEFQKQCCFRILDAYSGKNIFKLFFQGMKQTITVQNQDKSCLPWFFGFPVPHGLLHNFDKISLQLNDTWTDLEFSQELSKIIV